MTLEEFQNLTLPASLRTTAESDLDLMPDLVTFPAGTHVYAQRADATGRDSVRWQDAMPDMVAFAICHGWSWESRGGYCLEPGPEMAKVLAVLEPVEIAPPTENASW
jgi:hypothetical protein